MPQHVTKTELPAESALWSRVTTGDFLDCYAVNAATPPRKAAEIITTFPSWTKGLVRLRNILISPFGLSGSGPEAADKLGIFPVESETETELIAGFNDRHLDFRVSVFSQNGRVLLATWVHPHNLGGRLYLRVIMPFHILIARNAVARVAAAEAASAA